MEKIKDYEVYNLGMKKSIRDKLFWEGLIDDFVHGICDFGCADGQLLKVVHQDFPDWKLYGIDNDPLMVEMANETIPESHVYPKLSEMVLQGGNYNHILNISSVIHEVYSYCSEDQIDEFWDNIFDIGFRYVAIRDFMPSKTINGSADINDYHKILTRADHKQLSDFENIWGSVQDRKNMIHFLMKYRYTVNWSREVRENYFPITIEDLFSKIPEEYEIVYFNHFILPFNREKIRDDFDIELKENTHIKMLLKLK